MDKIKKLLKKLFCKHRIKTEIFRSYQDRYTKSKCDKCGKIIYEDL